MAIDTYEKKLSLIGYNTLPFRITLPESNGSLSSVGDLLHFVGLYSGIAPAPPPFDVFTDAIGWYADDDGLKDNWSEPHQIWGGERRRYWMSFLPISEIEISEDVISSASASIYPDLGSIVVGNIDFDDGKIAAPLYVSTNAIEGSYWIRFRATLEDGSIIVRSGPMIVNQFENIDTPIAGTNDVALQPGPGWYAANDGLVNAHAAPHRLDPDETRRMWMDFEPVAEIIAGDTIETSSPAPVVSSAPAGLAFANVEVSGTRVYVDVSVTGDVDEEYRAVFTIQTSSGAVISRAGVVRVTLL